MKPLFETEIFLNALITFASYFVQYCTKANYNSDWQLKLHRRNFHRNWTGGCFGLLGELEAVLQEKTQTASIMFLGVFFIRNELHFLITCQIFFVEFAN